MKCCKPDRRGTDASNAGVSNAYRTLRRFVKSIHLWHGDCMFRWSRGNAGEQESSARASGARQRSELPLMCKEIEHSYSHNPRFTIVRVTTHLMHSFPELSQSARTV